MTNSNSVNLFRRMPASLMACIVASSDELSGIDNELVSRFGQSFKTLALKPDVPVPAHTLNQADILVVEIDASSPASLERITQIRASAPDLVLIGAVRSVDITTVRTLVRRGVNDVISLPFDAEELFSAVIDLGSSFLKSTSDLAPIFGLVHSSGGAGASTVASHLAEALVQARPTATVCMVDLDLQFGELATLFGAEPTTTVLACLEAGERLDQDIIDQNLIEVRPHLYLLAAPAEIPPPEDIDTDQLLRVLSMLRQKFDFVILDLPSSWSNATLSAACSCSELLVIVDHSLRSLLRTRKTLSLLENVEFPSLHVKLIVNRAEKRLFQAVGDKEITAALGREVIASLPLVKSGLASAQERGALLGEGDRRMPFVKAIDELADYVVSFDGGDPS